jgi:hypothetical protein
LAATAGQATTVKVELGVSGNSTLFEQARIANACIERLHYGTKAGGFSTPAPCDFSAYTINYAADMYCTFARKVLDTGDKIIAWESLDSLEKTGSWSTWKTASFSTKGNAGQYVHFRGAGSYFGLNISYIEYTKEVYATPSSITFSAPTLGEDQALSWSAVSRAVWTEPKYWYKPTPTVTLGGYTIQVSRDGGTWKSFTSTTETSIVIPASEFATGGTRQFRVCAATSTRRDAGGYIESTTRTIVKPAQAAPTSVSSAAPTYGSDSTLSWTQVSTASSGYRVEISSNGGSTWSFLMNTTASATSTSVTVPKATFNTMGTRRYRVQALTTASYEESPWRESSTLTVQKAAQAAVSGTLGAATIAFGTATTLTASGGSGTGAYEFRQDGGTGTVGFSGSGASRTVTPSVAGTAVLQVRRLGNDNYNDSSWIPSGTLTVTKITQAALTLTPSTTHTYNTTRTYTASGGSGTGAYSDALGSGSATRTSAWNYRADAGSGTYTINVTRAADANYNAATKTFTLTMVKASQVAASGALGSAAITFGATTTVTASGGNGTGTYEFRQNGGTATVGFSGSGATRTLTPGGVGTALIEVRRLGDANHNDGDWASAGTLTIGKANQATVSGSLGAATLTFGATTTVTASGGTGTGAYEFRQNGGSATISFSGTSSSRTLTPTKAGTALIEVRRLGDANYNDHAWTSASTLTVNKAEQAALTLTPTTTHTYNTTRTYTAGGGTGTGAYSDTLASGSATRTSAWNYRADAGSGSYSIQVTRAGDANYNVRTETFTLSMTKASQDAPSSITFTAPTYGQSQTLSWTAVATATSGYRIEVSRNSGAYTLYTTVAAGVTSRALPATEFSTMGTRQFRVRANATATHSDGSWVTGTARTVLKAVQAALTLSPATAHRNTTTRRYTVGGGSGTGAVSDSLVSGMAERTGTLTYRAEGDSGSYVIRVIRAADDQYQERSQDFTIPLEAFRAIRYPGLEWETREGVRRR